MEVKVEIEKGEERNDSAVGKICNVEIKKATNGWIVCYRTKELEPGMKSTDHIDWKRKEIIFTAEKENEAFDYFKELKKQETDNSYY